jgi:hypothetical protein
MESPSHRNGKFDMFSLAFWGYSPLNIRYQLRPPVPRDIKPFMDPTAFTFEDALEDLLAVSQGEPLMDIDFLHLRRQTISERWPHLEPPLAYMRRLMECGLVARPRLTGMANAALAGGLPDTEEDLALGLEHVKAMPDIYEDGEAVYHQEIARKIRHADPSKTVVEMVEVSTPEGTPFFGTGTAWFSKGGELLASVVAGNDALNANPELGRRLLGADLSKTTTEMVIKTLPRGINPYCRKTTWYDKKGQELATSFKSHSEVELFEIPELPPS